MQEPDLNNPKEENNESSGEEIISPEEVGIRSIEPSESDLILPAEELETGPGTTEGENTEDVVPRVEPSELEGIDLDESSDYLDPNELVGHDRENNINPEPSIESNDPADLYKTYTARGWYNQEIELSEEPHSDEVSMEQDDYHTAEDTQPVIISRNNFLPIDQTNPDNSLSGVKPPPAQYIIMQQRILSKPLQQRPGYRRSAPRYNRHLALIRLGKIIQKSQPGQLKGIERDSILIEGLDAHSE